MSEPIKHSQLPLRLLAASGLILILFFCVGAVLFASIAFYEDSQAQHNLTKQPKGEEIPFPVSVDMTQKVIVENPDLEWYIEDHLSLAVGSLRNQRRIEKIFATLANFGLYQQLAAPYSRTLVVYAGERKEEVVDNFQAILRWSDIEASDFEKLVSNSKPAIEDGKFYPGRYVVTKDATPEAVAVAVLEKFHSEIINRYPASVEKQVPLETALIIASLLEREAYDFVDMRIISGIIWNRLFIEMPLQLDASLQYARGGLVTESDWWPRVVPNDKFIDSPFNTYEEKGLPPSPIANPSLEAVIAALNPKETNCLFYFHHTDGTFYCSETYEGHVEKLTLLYGRGS